MTPIGLFLCLLGFLFSPSQAFSSHHRTSLRKSTESLNSMNSPGKAEHHPFCDLPGDPSLILTTNVDLGDQENGNHEGM